MMSRPRQNGALDIVGLPAIEISRTAQVGQADAISRVSIAIPIRRRQPR
jgi:hypothetical protein